MKETSRSQILAFAWFLISFIVVSVLFFTSLLEDSLLRYIWWLLSIAASILVAKNGKKTEGKTFAILAILSGVFFLGLHLVLVYLVVKWMERMGNFGIQTNALEQKAGEAQKTTSPEIKGKHSLSKSEIRPERLLPTKRETHLKSLSGFLPELLDKYEPLEFLGEGGFAKVFKAKRKSDGKIVAVKIPRIDEKTSRTFIREVSTWLHLDYPNIVKLYDVDILPVPHLEMEYVEGVKLGDKIIRDLDKYPKPVEENTALKLIKGIAEGLAYAHFKGIYHRDLKPLNVLLKSDLTPKITDWGLAKIGTMSSGRSVLGYTPLYAAPEHLLPGKYGHTDARTDIWQLGVIFYELLTGKLPFEGYTYEEIFGKIVDESYKFTPPSEINPELAKYDGIFEKLLAKRKEDRYQSVEEFLKDLENLGEAKKRKAELEKEAEELKKSLSRSVAALKQSKSTEEAIRNRRMVVETLGKLALVYAELNRKAELLNTLNDLKFYTVQNLNDLLNAINTVETLLKENLPVGGDFIERLKVLVHNIKRENEEIVIVKQPPQKEKKSAKKEDCREYPSRVIPIEKARHSLRSKIRAIHVCLDGRWHRLEIPGGYWSQTLRTVAEFLIDKGFRNLQVDRFIEDRPEKLVRGDGAWDKIDGWYIYRPRPSEAIDKLIELQRNLGQRYPDRAVKFALEMSQPQTYTTSKFYIV